MNLYKLSGLNHSVLMQFEAVLAYLISPHGHNLIWEQFGANIMQIGEV